MEAREGPFAREVIEEAEETHSCIIAVQVFIDHRLWKWVLATLSGESGLTQLVKPEADDDHEELALVAGLF